MVNSYLTVLRHDFPRRNINLFAKEVNVDLVKKIQF